MGAILKIAMSLVKRTLRWTMWGSMLRKLSISKEGLYVHLVHLLKQFRTHNTDFESGTYVRMVQTYKYGMQYFSIRHGNFKKEA